MAAGRVLVIDDDADVRKLVRVTLVKAGLDERHAHQFPYIGIVIDYQHATRRHSASPCAKTNPSLAPCIRKSEAGGSSLLLRQRAYEEQLTMRCLPQSGGGAA